MPVAFECRDGAAFQSASGALRLVGEAAAEAMIGRRRLLTAGLLLPSRLARSRSPAPGRWRRPKARSSRPPRRCAPLSWKRTRAAAAGERPGAVGPVPPVPNALLESGTPTNRASTTTRATATAGTSMPTRRAATGWRPSSPPSIPAARATSTSRSSAGAARADHASTSRTTPATAATASPGRAGDEDRRRRSSRAPSTSSSERPERRRLRRRGGRAGRARSRRRRRAARRGRPGRCGSRPRRGTRAARWSRRPWRRPRSSGRARGR